MDRLNSILAVAERADEVDTVLEKSLALARGFGAQVEFLAADADSARAAASCRAAQGASRLNLRRLPRGDGPSSDILLDSILDLAPDLVVKAPGGAHALRRWSIDDRDWGLALASPVPLMLARPKQWSRPVRMAAAVDVADTARDSMVQVILRAARLFALGIPADLEILYSEREQVDQALRMERTVRLAQRVREQHLGCERIRRFEGPPQETLPAQAEERRYDVLVLGARPGGTTSRLIEATLGDVLLVKPAAGLAAGREPEASLRQQVADQLEEFA